MNTDIERSKYLLLAWHLLPHRIIMKPAMLHHMRNRKVIFWPLIALMLFADLTTRVNPFIMKISIFDVIMTAMCNVTITDKKIEKNTYY